MKIILAFIAILLSTASFGQQVNTTEYQGSFTPVSGKYEFLKGVTIDSTITIIGMGQAYDKTADSLERFWFILNNPEEILKLKAELVFKKKAAKVVLDKNEIDIEVIKDKKLIKTEGEFYPLQQKYVSNGSGWYNIDSSVLVTLHAEHPLKCYSQKFTFPMYLDYVLFADSIQELPAFIYLDKPTLKYQGTFEVIVDKDPQTSSSIFAEIELRKDLALLAPTGSFNTYSAINDKFNIQHQSKVKIMIECSKTLYDKYPNKNEKGAWQPNLFETIVYFRVEH